MSEIPGISRRSRPAEAAVSGAGVAAVLLVLNAAVELARVLPYWSGPGLTGSDAEIWRGQLLESLAWGITAPLAIGVGTFLALWFIVPVRPEHRLANVLGRAMLVSLVGFAVAFPLRMALPWIRGFVEAGWSGEVTPRGLSLPVEFIASQTVLVWLDALPVIVLGVICLWQWRRSRAERERASVAVAEHA